MNNDTFDTSVTSKATFTCKTKNNGILPIKNRILVIGDLHADFNKTKEIFINFNLIDVNENWIATPTDTVVVQLGDQLDGGGRGDTESFGELDLIHFMDRVHLKAEKAGGGVYSLIGNHEIMNLLGDFRYSSSKDIHLQGGIQQRQKLFSPGGDLFNKMSCTRNVILKIGDFIFVHAGILPEHIDSSEKSKFITKLNTLMRLYLQGKKTWQDEDIQKYFLDKKGVIWNRNYGDETLSKKTCSSLEKVNKLLNVGHMVVGHTVQDSINSKCDDKLWRVDVGISDAFGTSNMEILEILNNGVASKDNKFKPIRVLKMS
jgi:hypothetical protein